MQRAVIVYARLLENQGKLFVFHVPGGGWRSAIEAAIFKGLGVRAGVADLGFVLPGGVIKWIELKAGRLKLSPKQVEFAETMARLGCECVCLNDLEEVIDQLRHWTA